MVQNSQDVLFGRRAWCGMKPHAHGGDTTQPLQRSPRFAKLARGMHDGTEVILGFRGLREACVVAIAVQPSVEFVDVDGKSQVEL